MKRYDAPESMSLALDKVGHGDEKISNHNIAPVALQHHPSIVQSLVLLDRQDLVNPVDLYRAENAGSERDQVDRKDPGRDSRLLLV